MSSFFGLPAKTFTALAALIGFVLLDDLNANAQNTLANFLILVGQVLETSANQKIFLEGLANQGQPSAEDNLRLLETHITQLQQEVTALKALMEQQQDD